MSTFRIAASFNFLRAQGFEVEFQENGMAIVSKDAVLHVMQPEALHGFCLGCFGMQTPCQQLDMDTLAEAGLI